MTENDQKLLLPILKPLLDYFFEMNKIDLVVDYLAGKNNNRKEIKQFLEKLDSQISLENLLRVILQKQIRHHLGIFYFFRDDKEVSKKLEKQLKTIFINKIRNDFVYFQSSMLYLTSIISHLFIIDSFWDRTLDLGTSIFKVLLMYYVIHPILLSYIVKSTVIDNYIKEKIDSYEELLSTVDLNLLRARLEELRRPDYKHLFVQINELRSTGVKVEIPSLKYLAAFYVKDKHIDVNSTQIPEEVKEYVAKLS